VVEVYIHYAELVDFINQNIKLLLG